MSAEKDCQDVEPQEPLRQGDIVKLFADGKGEALAVVVTADCDIAQGKLGERGVACIEVKALRDFMAHDHLRRILRKLLSTREKEFRDWIRKKWVNKGGVGEALTDGALNDWFGCASDEEICNALGATEAEAKIVRTTLSAICVARSAQDGKGNACRTLQAIAGLMKSPPRDWRAFVLSQLEKLQANQLPEDLFFISAVPGEDGLGFVAVLRSLTFVPLHLVCEDVPQARERERAWARVGRLTPTFKHGLAQQIGVLFARIGYPRAYEVERNDIFDLVAESLAEELSHGHA